MRGARAAGLAVLVGALLAPGCAQPSDSGRKPLTLTQRIDSLVQAQLSAGPVPSAAVAVVRGADTLVLRGYGMADRETGRAAGPTTVYELGSITKQFTAAAIMRLVEQGKVGLEDDLSKYVPAFPLQGRHVSIRQLLNHTSGIPSVTADPGFQAASGRDLPPDSVIAFVAGDPFDFEPGTGWRYNNTGYVLLGMVIEKASGQAYATYLNDQFFQPLGLRHTGYCPPMDARDTSYAQGYTRSFQRATYISMTGPFSAGALCSNARDYVVWQRALHEGRMVNAQSYTLMTTPTVLPGGQDTGYGFGLFVSALGSYRMIQHSGGINGFATMQAYFPEPGLSVVVFTNTDAANPEPIAYKIAQAVLGLPIS